MTNKGTTNSTVTAEWLKANNLNWLRPTEIKRMLEHQTKDLTSKSSLATIHFCQDLKKWLVVMD